MRIKTRMPILLCCALAAAMTLGASRARAEAWTTAGANPSFITIDIILLEEVVATIGPLNVNGTADADVTGTGLTWNSSSLILDDSGDVLIDLGDLGTIKANLAGVGLDINSTEIPLTGGLFDIDNDPPSALTLALNQGLVNLFDGTGFLDGVEELLDLATDPQIVDLAQLLGAGLAGSASPSEIALLIPGALIDLTSILDPEGEGLLLLRLTGEINLVPVPEPSSVALASSALVGVAVYGFYGRRRRR